MKRVVLLIVVAGGLLMGVVVVLRKGAPRPVAAPPPAVPPPVAVTNAPAVSNVAPVSVVPPLAATPAEILPKGWEDFRKLREIGQLNRVTSAMENRTLPFDLLAFFEKEIFNRQHWDVTRTNDSLRRTAMATLGLIGTRDDRPLLQPGLTNRNRAVQMAAQAAIRRLQER
jgi:hypothetical protein